MHKIKIQKWIGNQLETINREFVSWLECVEHLVHNRPRHPGAQIKVYDDQGQLVHSEGSLAQDTYA